MNALRSHGSVEPWIGMALVLCAGAGALLGLAGALGELLPMTVAGGALLAVGLTTLVATGWLDGVLLVAVSLPLPALLSTPSLRIATAAPVTAAVVLAAILALGASGRRLRTGRLPGNAVALLFATFLVATVTAQHIASGARETLNFAVLLGFLLVATDRFGSSRDALPRATRLLIGIGAVCGLLAIFEMVGIIPGEFPRYETGFNRAALGFGQPNGLGLFLAVILPFALHEVAAARSVEAKVATGGAVACLLAGLVATFSRGSWLAVLAGAGALLFTGNRRLVVRLFVGAAIVAVLADVVTGGAMRDTVERTIGDWVIEQRAALMLAGIMMFLAYPVTGVGPGNYAESLDLFGPQIPQLWDYLPTPHNAYVQMAAENGILGLLAFVTLLAITVVLQIRRTRADDADPIVTPAERAMNRALLWSMATACAACMVVWPFAHGTGQAVMLVMAGIFAVPPRQRADHGAS